MIKVSFEKRKQDCLLRADKSSIGRIDEKIKKLCENINQKTNYYTLSSCSGRIVLIKNIKKKQPDLFIFKSHEKIKPSELKEALKIYEKGKENLIFKQEPCIMHIACKTLDDAKNLLKKAQQAGLKHSGIISISGSRIVLEIKGSEQLALPIMEKGKIIVDENFLKVLVEESNKRLSATWEKIKKLEKEIEKK